MTDEEERMTRREYREQQAHRKQNQDQRPPEQDTGSPDDDNIEIQNNEWSSDSPIADEGMSREEQQTVDYGEQQAEKTARLKKRLNLIIAGLVVAIIIVYLILFFVG